MNLFSTGGYRHFRMFFVLCPNPKCKNFTLSLTMSEYGYSSPVAGVTPGGWKIGKILQQWNLIPPSSAKIFPEYVPKPIRDDYTEACLIRDLSAKASATLSRRCLQGMIRDFWGIKKARLIDEIDALKDKTDDATWEAINAVRKIGNIGAHMEKDIDVIVEVEPKEAQLLIGLIELLVKDWYVTRHQRQERLKEIKAIAEAKEAAKGRAKP